MAESKSSPLSPQPPSVPAPRSDPDPRAEPGSPAHPALPPDTAACSVPAPGAPACLELIAATVRRTPSRPAIQLAGRTVDYAELARRSDALADRLAELAPGPGGVVGVRATDRVEYVVALLAALKAGVAFLPLDPEAPQARQAAILADSGAVLLSDGAAHAGTAVRRIAHPGEVAYVIYTSGTTGIPKGVAVGRGVLDGHLATARERFGITPDDVVLQFSAPYVDVWVEQVLTALTAGARLAVTEARVTAPAELAALIRREGVTVANLPAGYWQEFTASLDHYAGELASLRLMVCGSDTMPAASAARWLRVTGIGLLNAYGPTEAVITSLVHEVRTAQAARPVPIGRSLGARELHVLDEELNEVADGVTGELCIGGATLALGYLNRPGLTAQRFVPDPFSPVPGARMYRTGDLVRRLADGTVEFGGRRDDQVKVRGYRIELGEIENALAAHPQVATCAVTVYEPTPGDRRLAAYVTAERNGLPRTDELQRHLRALLPAYMVPAAFTVLPALPLTANGKIDRRALPAPAQALPQAAGQAQDDVPSSELERLIAGIWSETLGVDGIGLDENFFNLGGDSLTALRVAGRMLETPYADVSHVTVFEAPTVRELAAAMTAASASAAGPELTRRPATSAPLSGLQRGLWTHAQFDPDSTAYNIPWVLEFDGPVDPAALQAALDGLVARHEVLRTTFGTERGEPRQLIHAPRPAPLAVTDLTALTDGERAAAQTAAIEEDARAPFDLAAGPLFRVRLIQHGDEHSTLVAVFHHIVWDESSLAVFERELGGLYTASLTRGEPELAQLPVQYADYARWQQEKPERLHLDYWVGQLRGAPEVTGLPADRPRTEQGSSRGDSHRFEIPAGTVTRVRELARAEGATPFTVLLAAFAALVHRHSQGEDLVIGTPVTTRSRAELDGLIGCFLTMLPLRLTVGARQGFRDLVRHVRDTSFDAHAHRDIPLDGIVNAVLDDRRLDVSPLFQTAFELHPASGSPVRLGELTGTRRLHAHQVAKFEQVWMIEDPGTALRGWIEFDARLYDRATVAAFCREWIDSLAHYTTDPAAAVGEPVAAAGTVVDLFEEQVRISPEAVALVQVGAGEWSYRELDERANQVAWWLRGHGVGVGDRVGLHLARSLECVAAMLGVLKAGAAYLPLEPGVPFERLAHFARDAAPGVVVSADPATAAGLGVRVLDLADPELHSRQTSAPAVRLSPEDAFYVPYTSGSTGVPKGTLVPHRAVPGFFAGQGYACWGPGAAAVLHSALSWDGHLLDLYPALLSGGRVLIPDPGDRDPISVAQFAADHGATVLLLSAAAFGAVVTADPGLLKNLRDLILGGDRIPSDHFRRMLTELPGTNVVHIYGPSEATVAATVHQVRPADLDREVVPIGRALGDRAVHVLDERLRPSAEGEVGELYIAGPALGHGYLNRVALTAQKFLPDPFSAEPGARLYRTGDLVRRLPDGVLEFIGRRDGQVKVRGYRIELGEIENALAAHPQVATCAVIVHEPAPGQKQLAAYLTAEPGVLPQAAELRHHLLATLPEYMVPASFTPVAELPLTPHGKVDRRALPAPDLAAGRVQEPDTGNQSPAGDLERRIADIWSEVLGVPGISVDDNFFQLGGDSLRAVRVAVLLAETLDREVPPRLVFNCKTVSALAAHLA
ncbi:amino acid adenylation domain-containing protein [Kitasatospora sp. RB6PN24]|uniref:non-ribosomal peptide synthetase n=1 Tax=Kitasatospora humi TaxID=2893891 RepID=UPI001E621EDF|nr:non-ribosomal peptide synthetase [Kitasatospora humi]MCC9308102.1 amino acid adenylation domain-containing protein [Kitasatospora humi]